MPIRDSEGEQRRLAVHYNGLNEAELERLAGEARSLTDEAKTALRQAIARRGLAIFLEQDAPKRIASQRSGRTPHEKSGSGWTLLVLALFVLILWLGVQLLTGYATRRTATVREVFLHGPSPGGGPKVFMNDGSVWELGDTAGQVAMLRGDEIRYINKVHDGATAEDTCDLYDTTTGYRVVAFRLSAPYVHTSCPAQ